MKFDLISLKSYEGKIDMLAFDDLGLQTLFDDFYDHNWSDLQSVMELIPKEEEIRKRQLIFSDFLCDEEDTLKTFKRLLEELRDAYKNFLSIDGGLKSHILFTQYIDKLVNFIDKGRDILNNLTFSSIELNKMKDFFNEKAKDSDYIKLKEDLDNAVCASSVMTKLFVSYVTLDKFIKTNKFEENKTDLLSKLEGYMDDLNVKYIKEDVNLIRHDLDPYYFNRLDYIYPNESKVLADFFKKYRDNISYDYDTLSRELNYYLKIKLLFNHAKERNVSYTMVDITDSSDVYMNDLADITIINKVDYIQVNDYASDDIHHMQIVTGANGGGKTTYLRSIGANYIFFTSLGYVFAKSAKLKAIKHLFTHFPNDENYQVGYGRLQDEIRRIDMVRGYFSKDTLYLMNETFSSTDEDTAFKETKKLFKEIEEKHVNMVFITHQQLLLEYIDKEKVILLNPIVDVDDNNKRTFKIRRVDAKVHAYAEDILRKYGLSKDILDKKRRDLDV